MLKRLLNIGFCFLILSVVSGSAAVDFLKSSRRLDGMIATCNCQKADWIQYFVLRANDHVRRLADWFLAVLDSAYNVSIPPCHAEAEAKFFLSVGAGWRRVGQI